VFGGPAVNSPREKEKPVPNIGPMELVVVLVIALLVLGPKRLPAAGKSLGQGIREFKNSISGKDDEKSTKDVLDA
jgi:sec-independent protein translocase protein TatA